MNDAKLYLEIAVWSQIASSVVFIAVLVFMWFRWFWPLLNAAQERSNRQIAEAERHRDEAKAALDALRQEIDTAHHDAELIGQRVSDRVEHEREGVLKETTEAGERALADAGRELERARAAARQRLRDQVVDAALRLARADAKRRVDPAADARLVGEFVGSLEGAERG
jgi:ATP synthase F0 subunit b